MKTNSKYNMNGNNNFDFNISDSTQFFDISHDGFMIANEEGRIVYMNAASERIEQISKHKIVGKLAEDLVNDGIYKVSVTNRVFKEKRSITIKQENVDKEILITGVPIMKDNKVKWVVINERDLTELKTLKQEVLTIEKEVEKYKQQLAQIDGFKDQKIIAKSSKMKTILSLLKRIAPTDVIVLLKGESGVGKSLFAKWIHDNSERSSSPYVNVDCSVLPPNLLESELFGYKSGAFTGAKKEGKVGLVESANKGTLFLDEIGELDINLQAKLLRLVQDKVILPVGSTKTVKVDVRIITATNKNLEKLIEQGLFRSDLYYRINVLPIEIPPLRERPDDLLHLLQYYLDFFNERYPGQKYFSTSAISILTKYDWPGNIRELSNIVERAVITSEHERIDLDVIDSIISPEERLLLSENDDIQTDNILDAYEKKALVVMLKEYNTYAKLAKALKISLSTAKRKCKKHGLKPGGVNNE